MIRPATPNALMLTLWRAQGRHCGVCGDPMVAVTFNHPTRGWTIEHVWPRARYRYQHEGNRFVSHSQCNHAKADRDPTRCELIILALVNAVLGLELTERCLSWRDEASGPTAMEAAFAKARAA